MVALAGLLATGCVEPHVGPRAGAGESGVADSPSDSAPLGETGDSVAPESGPPPDTADSADTADTGPTAWRSALYPEAWTPEFTAATGEFLHDFSYAGYHAGEVALPSPPPGASFDVTVYGADPTGSADSTAAVQAAIDAASAGAPAVVDFPAGTYRFDGSLRVSTSGVALRGAGSTSTFLYFTSAEGLDYAADLTFAGAIAEGGDHLFGADLPARSTVIPLTDTAGIAVGDTVHLGWTISPEFVTDHGMDGVWTAFNGEWRAFFRRTVVAVDAGGITVDVPTRYPMLMRDGASVRVATGYLTENGLQDLAISNVNSWEPAWAHMQVHAVLFSGVQDAWVSGVASWESPLSTDGKGMHLMSSGIEVLDSRRVTIADTTLQNAQNRGDGGNGYLFEISRSNEILTRDCTAVAGRHNFIQNWDFGSSGLVWLRDTTRDGRAMLGDWDPWGYAAYSEYHHSLAMANLVDSCTVEDGWQGVNRQTESTGAGQSVTESVFWNTRGGGYLRSLQYGNGYVIGTTAMDVHTDPTEWDWNNAGEGTEPSDWTEGLDEPLPLEPASLYEDQLGRR